MKELVQLFGMLFMWALMSVLACLVLVGIFAAVWIPMCHWMFRYDEKMQMRKHER